MQIGKASILDGNQSVLQISETMKILIPYGIILFCLLVGVVGYFIWGDDLIQDHGQDDEPSAEETKENTNDADQIGEL